MDEFEAKLDLLNDGTYVVSVETSDSEDEEQTEWTIADRICLQRHNDRYFVVIRHQPNMAMKVDNSRVPDQEDIMQGFRPLSRTVSMSDLAIPDHLGWLTDQTEQRRVWCVVVDMLFCVFEDQTSERPEEVILLPGCNIRPLVYKTAINGVNVNKQCQTVSGIAKYQLVIDNASTAKKHVFGTESQSELDGWFNVLKKASALDPETANDISTSSRRGSSASLNKSDISSVGYTPSQNSQSRLEKLSSSQPSSPRDPPDGGGMSAGGTNGMVNGCQPSPRTLVRHDSRRQSIQDFKKKLRREAEPEVSKNQPMKAQHFKNTTATEEAKSSTAKKLRSFGSFESLLKFKKKRKKDSEDSVSNDDTGSVVSTSSIEQDMVLSNSVDFENKSSKLKKTKSKQLSKSLDLGQPKNGLGNEIVRRASDIKDKVFLKRQSKPVAKLVDLREPSIGGFLHHKTHLKWQKLWCVVCRGNFYGFKSQSAEETASISAVLSNCVVVYVAEKDKRQKHVYVFKLSQESKRSIYLCTSDYRDLQQWLMVLQMESNSVIANAHKIRAPTESESESMCSSLSSQNGSILNPSSSQEESGSESSRSRSRKKKKAPAKPPRRSSCPPPSSRDQMDTERGSESSTTEGATIAGTKSGDFYDPTVDEVPSHDRAVSHVWQSDRGYLFNIIRAKMKAHRKQTGDIYNKDLPGPRDEGLLLLQDPPPKSGSRGVRRTQSFTANGDAGMSEGERVERPMTPQETGSQARRRHKPLVVKKVSVAELRAQQTCDGYMERKSVSTQWIKYWYVLHEGTLFCYLTPEDTVTVDVLNLHGYSVSSLVDKFRGKRFILQLSHENFAPLYLSLDTREEMDAWAERMNKALSKPSSTAKEHTGDTDQGACAGCDGNGKDEVGEKRQQVKQKLLEEMLRQKHELERKQAQRQRKLRPKENDSLESTPNANISPEVMSEEQRLSDVTRLRQRRMSAQLKVDSIQRQMTKPSNSKKGLFSFGKKKIDENKNDFLQDQLNELNSKLNKIDSDLSHVQHDKHNDVYDVNQNRKSMPPEFFSSRSHESVDEDEVFRGAGIKNAMHKWTNKTFSKTAAKKKQSSDIKANGSVPNLNSTKLTLTTNGERHEFEGGSNCDDHSWLDSSVTDLTRPTADLKLDLSTSQNGGHSPSTRYSRSNSRGSNVSSLSSPRREIDPSVLAEINAFEELTKQVLGARSKETASK